MNKLILLVGIPGVGKSYFIKKYLETYPDEYIICSADHHFENLAKKKRAELEAMGDLSASETPEYLFDFSQLRQAHINCQNKCLRSMEQGIPLIFIDNTSITKKERQFYVHAAIQNGYEISIKAFPNDEETIKLAASRNQHGVPEPTIRKRALAQDLEPGNYKVDLDPEDMTGKRYMTTKVLESNQFIKKALIKECTLDEVTKDTAELKEKITSIKIDYPFDKFPEVAEALADMTGALDVLQHHVSDITEKI